MYILHLYDFTDIVDRVIECEGASITGPVDNAKTAYQSNSAILAHLPYMI